MSISLLIMKRLAVYFRSLEVKILSRFNIPPPFQGYNLTPALIGVPADNCDESLGKFSESSSSIFQNGFLWAVPTHRVSVERRLTRKMAIEKRIKPKRNLIMCNVCGHYHEGHTICGNCYEKVRVETEAMQAEIQNTWKLNPVDKEVVVVYENDDRHESHQQFWKGKRIVEIKKERPLWFHQNLEVSTRHPDASDETSVVPSKSIIPKVK